MDDNNKASQLTQAVPTTTKLSPVRAQIISQSPGRVRFRVSHPHRQKRHIEPITDALKQRLEIYRVRSNVDSGSITVYHAKEHSTFEDIRAILRDLGIIILDVTGEESVIPGEKSAAAAQVTSVVSDLNQRVKELTNGAVDLRFLVPLGFSALALRQLLAKGWQLEIIPWYVLAWYAFDSFVKFHYTSEPEQNVKRKGERI
jgi:hypothetical protein